MLYEEVKKNKVLQDCAYIFFKNSSNKNTSYNKALWYVEGYDTDEELALAFCEEFGCASADKIRLECMAEE